MKKLVSVFAVGILIVSSTNAQNADELKPFKVDISLGYAIPGGSGSKGGGIFVVEPKYAVAGRFAIGLRLETAVIARFSGGFDANGNPVNEDVKASGSYLATGDYYFSDNYSFRPFAGGGAGIFSIATEALNNDGSNSGGFGTKFGGMIRAGIEAKHFRFGLEYNIVPSIDIPGFDSNGNPITVNSKNGYIGIKVGVCLGGGPR